MFKLQMTMISRLRTVLKVSFRTLSALWNNQPSKRSYAVTLLQQSFAIESEPSLLQEVLCQSATTEFYTILGVYL